MTKSLLKYTKITPEDISTRSSDISDNSINGDYLDVDNVKLISTSNIIEDVSDAGLYELHNSLNVNEWSNFGPYDHVVSFDDWSFRLKPEASLGNFAGYNHNAIEPYAEILSTDPSTLDIWYGQHKLMDFNVRVHLGEINYPAITNGFGVRVRLNDVPTFASPLVTHTVSNDYSSGSLFVTSASGDDVYADSTIPNVSLTAVSDTAKSFWSFGQQFGTNGSLPLMGDSANPFSLPVNLHILDVSQGSPPSYCACTDKLELTVLEARWYEVGISPVEEYLFINYDNCFQWGCSPDCSVAGHPEQGYTNSDGYYVGTARISYTLYEYDRTVKDSSTILDTFELVGDESQSINAHINTGLTLGDVNYTDYIEVYINIFE